MSAGWVRLSVGGQKIVTSRQTLCQDRNSVLFQMFSEDSSWPVDQDEDGSYLIDADINYFTPILNFLRMGEVVIPPAGVNPSGVKALAMFLGVQGVIDHFNRERRQVIFSCGSGGSGELGTLEKADAPTPTMVKLIPYHERVTDVSLGANFSALLTSTGKVYTFGNGDWGQLGIGSPKLFSEKADDRTPIVTVPTVVPLLENKKVIATSSGYAYCMALVAAGDGQNPADNEVYFWGNNNHGQSGLGQCYFGASFRKVEEPVLVESLQGKSIIQLGCGSFFVLALSATGDMYSWGLVDCLGLGTAEEVVARYGATDIAESVSKDKRTVLLTPQKLAPLQGTNSKVVRISAGQWHSCAITEDGSLFSVGVGFQGRLGHGDKEPRYIMAKITGALEGRRVVEVACGSFHTVALTADGLVYCWGDNTNGQCGSSQLPESCLRPNPVTALTVVGGGVATAVSCGRQHTAVCVLGPHAWCNEHCCKLRHDGKPQAEHGQLFVFGESKGTGCGQVAKIATAKHVTGVEKYNVRKVVSGLHHSFMLCEQIVSDPY